jgi:dCMP deaminase
MRRKDLTGQRFGDLVALRYVIKQRGKKRRGKWECACDCGKTVEVLPGNLLRGNSTSCGCRFLRSKKYNFTDLTGKKFGALSVVEKSDKLTKTRGVLWICKCDCGKEVQIPSNSLTSGNTLTCRDRKNHPLAKWNGEIPACHVSAIKQNAIKRNLSFTVTPEFLWNLFLLQDRRCALSDVELTFTKGHNPAASRAIETTASLDRIDSDRGYDADNVRWVHKDLNRMRWALDDATFLEWCRKCLERHDRLHIPSWDEYFMKIAKLVAIKSKDRSTKVGAVIVSDDRSILGTGYNGFPRGVTDDVEERQKRPTKYMFTSHAEANCITNAARNGVRVQGCKLYVASMPEPLPICADCARAIIQSGIIEVVVGSVTPPERWKESVEAGIEMFKEAGVKVTLFG